MRYSLRELLIMPAIMPPLSWIGWTKYEAWQAERGLRRARLEQAFFHAIVRTQDAISTEALKLIRENATKNGPSADSDPRPSGAVP
jgi:hypothetical protein